MKVLCQAKTKLNPRWHCEKSYKSSLAFSPKRCPQNPRNAKDSNGLTPLHVAAFRGDDAEPCQPFELLSLGFRTLLVREVVE